MTASVARCPHCGQQHPKEMRTCPATGQAMPGTLTAGDLLNGRYRVVRHSGDGGLGGIYEADAGGGRRVSVEIAHPDMAIDPDALGRFYEEARVPGGPHVAQVLDAGRAGDGSPYLVLEPLDGQTLAARLATLGGKMPAGRAAHIVKQVLEALGPLHRQGLVHRALAPEHIFLVELEGDPDYVKLLDFGFARLLGEDAAGRARTSILGYPLPHFLAPEQAQGRQPDHRADIYACGVLLYTMITGRLPYEGRDVPSLLQAAAAGRYQPPRAYASDLQPELEQAIGYAMALDPGHRYQSADHLMQTLAPLARPAAVAAGGRERTLLPSSHETPPPLAVQMDEITPKSPSKVVPIAVGAGLAVAVLGVLLAVRSPVSPTPQKDTGEVTAKPSDTTDTADRDEKPADTQPDTPREENGEKPTVATTTGTPSTPTEEKPTTEPVAAATPDAAPATTATTTTTTTAAATTTTPDAAPATTTAAATGGTPDAGTKTTTTTTAAVEPTKPKPAILTFNVTPADATITVDGKPLTARPGKIALLPGGKPVKVSVSAPGYVAFEDQVSVKGDDTLDIQLKKQATATKPPTKSKPKPKPRPRIEL